MDPYATLSQEFARELARTVLLLRVLTGWFAVTWLVGLGVVWHVAGARNRGPGWLLVGLCCGPLVALLALLALPVGEFAPALRREDTPTAPRARELPRDAVCACGHVGEEHTVSFAGAVACYGSDCECSEWRAVAAG